MAADTIHRQHITKAAPTPTQLLRLPAVRAMTGLGTTKIYELIGNDQFPRPVVLARARNGQPRTVAWLEREVHAFIAARVAERDAQQTAASDRPRKGAGLQPRAKRDRASSATAR